MTSHCFRLLAQYGHLRELSPGSTVIYVYIKRNRAILMKGPGYILPSHTQPSTLAFHFQDSLLCLHFSNQLRPPGFNCSTALLLNWLWDWLFYRHQPFDSLIGGWAFQSSNHLISHYGNYYDRQGGPSSSTTTQSPVRPA